MASIRQLRPYPSSSSVSPARATSSAINDSRWRPGSALALSRLSPGHRNCHWRNKLFVLTALVTRLISLTLV